MWLDALHTYIIYSWWNEQRNWKFLDQYKL